jgi:putative transcriptional regulator
MIKLKLDEMLREKNMTAYALHIKSGLHQSVISKIKRNLSKALQLDVLDTLCKALECQPGDLMTCENESATQAVNTQSVNDTQSVKVSGATQSVNTTQNVERATQSVYATQSASDNEIIGSVEVASILGINQSLVTRYAKEGRLKGQQGRKGTKRNVWTFRRSDVLEFMPT